MGRPPSAVYPHGMAATILPASPHAMLFAINHVCVPTSPPMCAKACVPTSPPMHAKTNGNIHPSVRTPTVHTIRSSCEHLSDLLLLPISLLCSILSYGTVRDGPQPSQADPAAYVCDFRLYACRMHPGYCGQLLCVYTGLNRCVPVLSPGSRILLDQCPHFYPHYIDRCRAQPLDRV